MIDTVWNVFYTKPYYPGSLKSSNCSNHSLKTEGIGANILSPISADTANQQYKGCPHINSLGIAWDLIRNAESQSLLQTY